MENSTQTNTSLLNEEKYRKAKNKLNMVGKCLLIIGGVSLLAGIICLFVGMSKIWAAPSPEFPAVMIVGIILMGFGSIGTGAGLILLLISHARAIGSFAAQTTLPLAKDVSEYAADKIAPSIGRGLTNVVKPVATGIATSVAEAKNSTKQKCAKCGHVLNYNDKFCPDCGTSVNAKRVCPNCATEVQSQNKFCQNCGYKLEQ